MVSGRQSQTTKSWQRLVRKHRKGMHTFRVDYCRWAYQWLPLPIRLYTRPNQSTNIFIQPTNTLTCWGRTYYMAFGWLDSFFSLVRTDAMAYINLTGLSYCSSARYCDFLCSSSPLFEGSQSASRVSSPLNPDLQMVSLHRNCWPSNSLRCFRFQPHWLGRHPFRVFDDSILWYFLRKPARWYRWSHDNHLHDPDVPICQQLSHDGRICPCTYFRPTESQTDNRILKCVKINSSFSIFNH